MHLIPANHVSTIFCCATGIAGLSACGLSKQTIGETVTLSMQKP